jgi:hypothetical protein
MNIQLTHGAFTLEIVDASLDALEMCLVRMTSPQRKMGQGSIYQRKDGTWEASLMRDGNLKKLRAKDESDAEAKLEQIKEDMPHIHKWHIEAPNGPVSIGRCKCGLQQEFKNSKQLTSSELKSRWGTL